MSESSTPPAPGVPPAGSSPGPASGEGPGRGLRNRRLGERIARRVVRGPFGRHLGFEVQWLAPDEASIRLPVRETLRNGVGVVHGGAIAALADTAATAAAWCHDALDEGARGATVGFSVNFLSPGRGGALVALARVVRRGRTIVVVEVGVRDEQGGEIARGLVTYRLRAGAGRSPARPEGGSIAGP